MSSREEHRASIREEFARQADAMEGAAAFTSGDVLERIAALVGAAPDEHLLDVACGPGILAARLASDLTGSGELVGVDLTPEMLERARARCKQARLANTSFREADATALPFPDGSFDVVVSRLALHHLLEPGAAVAEMARVVRPEGRVVIADVISADDHEDAALHNALERLRDPSHVRMLGRSELRTVLERAGLRVERQETFEQPRSFDEWLAITASPARAEPIEVVMTTLARAGLRAGIDLRLEDAGPAFTHTWLLARALRAP